METRQDNRPDNSSVSDFLFRPVFCVIFATAGQRPVFEAFCPAAFTGSVLIVNPNPRRGIYAKCRVRDPSGGIQPVTTA